MRQYGLFRKEDVARRFGLAVATIDDYSSAGLLHPIRLHDGTFFTASDFMRLEIIAKGKDLGFRISEIKKLIEQYSTPGSHRSD